MRRSYNPPNRLERGEQRIRVTVDLVCAGGFDGSELELIAREFVEHDLPVEISGLYRSCYQAFRPDRREAIIDALEKLNRLDPRAARNLADCLPVSLHDDVADYWFTDEAEELLEETTDALEELEAEAIEAWKEANPHEAEMEEAALSLYDPDTDLLDCYS